MAVAVKESTSWEVRPCSLVESYRRFRETYCLQLPGMFSLLTDYSAYSSNLKMDGVISSEESVNFYYITRHHIVLSKDIFLCLIACNMTHTRRRTNKG
jgi:hypothetical protein